MKTALLVSEVAPPPALLPALASDPSEGKEPLESVDLSPQRIEDGASTKTELLEKILAQTSTVGHFRHWGINE